MRVENLGQLASQTFMGRFSPAITKNTNGYSVRIFKSCYHDVSGNSKQAWDYFDTDLEGKILKCPRGMTKEFKGKIVDNIEASYKEYKEKRL
jgi:hypothetical protein